MIASKPQITDLFMNKKNVQKSSPFRFVFLTTLLFVPLLLIGIGFSGAVALKSELASSAWQARISFDEAIDSLTNEQYARSAEAFLQVSQAIEQMQQQLEPFYLNTKLVQKDDPALLALLDSGEQLAAVGLRLTALAPQLRDIPFALLRKQNILPLLADARSELIVIDRLLQDVEADLAAIDLPLLPTEVKANIETLQILLPEGKRALSLALAMMEASEILLGKEFPQTIAVFFQNSNEIRATGGFPGSMGFVRTNDGTGMFEFRDIYSFAWKNATAFPPPEGFERLATKLTLQDANADFDFPASAGQLRRMLEYSAAPTAETIVTVSDDLLAALLAVSGPIPIPDADEQLTADNASLLLSFFVESKWSGKHSPKALIADLLPSLIARLQEVPPERLMQIAKRAIREKWILAHSTDPQVQRFFTLLGVDGAIRDPQAEDYLAVVSANVGGNKSDAYLLETLTIDSVVALDGMVTDTLTIRRKHTWSEQDAAEVERLIARYGSGYVAEAVLKNILGAGDNHSYTEVFVPLGAELVSVRGIPREAVNIREEDAKTVFAFRYPAVAAGTTEAVTLQYRLPQPIETAGEFDLYFQSQPGRNDTMVTRSVFAEAGIDVSIGAVAGKALSSDAIFHSQLVR